MEKSLPLILEKINKQHNRLKKLFKNTGHYYQFVNCFEEADFVEKLRFCKEFKPVQQILTKKEFNYLLNFSEIHHAYSLIAQMEFNLDFGLCEKLLTERVQCPVSREFTSVYQQVRYTKAWIFPHENNVIDIIIVAPIIFSDSHPTKKKKAFCFFPEAEFVAFCNEKRCYVVRMLSGHSAQDDINKALKPKFEDRWFSLLSYSRYEDIKNDIFKFKKKMMLTYEYYADCLLEEALGEISFADFVRKYNRFSFADWLKVLNIQSENDAFISLQQKHWNMIAYLENFNAVTETVEKAIHDYEQDIADDDDDDENGAFYTPFNQQGFWLYHEKARVVFYIYNNNGWIAEIYVRSKLQIEFIVLRRKILYVVKFVKDINNEPRVKELLSKQNSV